MSRSRKKTPIFGITTSGSEKEDKQLWHRRFRRSADIEKTDKRLFSNRWNMDKDGKQYCSDIPEKYMRK